MPLMQNFLINDFSIFINLVHNEKLSEKCLRLIENNHIRIKISNNLQKNIEEVSSDKKKKILKSKKDNLKIQTESPDTLTLSQENPPFILIEKDSSLPFEITKINSKEFDEYIDIISQMNLFLWSEIYTITSSFLALKSISKLSLETINEYPHFFPIVINSLQTNFYTKLRRIFYEFDGSYDINSFIEKLGFNIYIFSFEILIKRKGFSDIDFIKKYSKNCQAFSINSFKKDLEKLNIETNKYLRNHGEQLLFHIKRITYQLKQKYEKKFKSIGHKVFSHLDRDITGNEKKLFGFLNEELFSI